MDIFQQFTWPELAPNLMVNVIWALIVTGLFRFVMFAFSKAPTREYLYWISVPLFLFVAGMSLAAHLGSGGRPSFRVTVEEVVTGTISGAEGQEVPFASVIASVRNTGTPSAVSGLRFTVRIGEGPATAGSAQTLLEEMRIAYENGVTETVYGRDALNIRGEAEPIQRGGVIRGRMLYIFPDVVSVKSLSAVGATYELTVTDAWGTEYKGTIKRETPGQKATLPNYPQIESRFTKPPGSQKQSE